MTYNCYSITCIKQLVAHQCFVCIFCNVLCFYIGQASVFKTYECVKKNVSALFVCDELFCIKYSVYLFNYCKLWYVA